MTDYLIQLLSDHKSEIMGFAWRTIPVLLGSEFLSRLVISWVEFTKIGSKFSPERIEKLGKSLGLTANLILSFSFVMLTREDQGVNWIVFWSMVYGGSCMVLHWLFRPMIIKLPYFKR